MRLSLRQTMKGFAANSALSAKALRDLYESDPSAFVADSRAIIEEDVNVPGLSYLLVILLRDNVILKWLCDPTIFTTQVAIRIVEVLRRIDPRVDMQLMSLAFPPSAAEATVDERAALRILELVAAVGDSVRSLPMVARLLRHNSPRVRSKAALIVGRGNRNPKWVFRQLSEGDARHRANALESLWGAENRDASAVFWSALSDPDNRAVGNAILGLYRLGAPESISLVLNMVNHTDARFRDTGIWIIEQTGDVRFEQVLATMMLSYPEHRDKIARASDALKQIIETRAQQPPLRILINRAQYDAESGWVKLNVVPLSKVEPVSGLLATQFAIWSDANLVQDYEVKSIAEQNPAALAFIIPRSLDRYALERLVTPFRNALRYRRRSDLWTILKYRNVMSRTKEITAVSHSIRSRTLGLELGSVNEQVEETRSFDGNENSFRIAFSEDNDRLEDMLLKMGTNETSAQSVSSAVLSLMNAMPHGRLKREIVVLLDELSANLPSTAAQPLIDCARAKRIVLNTLSSTPSEFGEKLAAETGGRHLASSSAEDWDEMIESISAVVAAGYQVRFRVEGAKPTSVRLHVHTHGAAGEIACRL